ncbi:MAG: VCBS repeat-containing protein, partial [Candidatus Omnitrophica bacterium]|nr:VCBS repeat-containing protein [Candidatus Omnitrophota bacterium]
MKCCLRLGMSALSVSLLVIQSIVFLPVVAAENGLASFSSLSTEADPHSGSVNLTIPIQIPPGRNAIQPNLTIQYNSSSPNGMFGVGWNFELGSIKILNRKGAPNYDGSDAYVLMQNGGSQELIYNPQLDQYHPKIETDFMKIQKINGSWLITDTAGTKYFFGQDSSSQEFHPEHPQRVYKWGLDRVEDINGNYMRVSYFKEDNVIYPQEIRYTGFSNGQQTLDTYAAVKFIREGRQDHMQSFIRGFEGIMRNRISRIEVYAGGVLQRAYDFTYQYSPDSGRSLIQSVQLIGADGGTDLPAMQYVYQRFQQSNQSEYEILTLDERETVSSGDNLWNVRIGENYDRGDENSGPLPGFDVELGQTYTQPSGLGGLDLWNMDPNGRVWFRGYKDTAYLLWTYVYSSIDQQVEVPYKPNSGANPGVYINNSITDSGELWHLKKGWNLIVMTMYNQHEDRFLFEHLTGIANLPNILKMNSTSQSSSDIVGDFNGDGFTDLASVDPVTGTVKVAIAKDQSFAPEEEWISGFGTNAKVVVGDYNGDGRMDLMTHNTATDQIEVALSQPNNTFTSDGSSWRNGFSANELLGSGDFNYDGLSDLYSIFPQNGALKLWIEINTGGSFDGVNHTVHEMSPYESDIPVPGDYNGDGLLDLGGFNKASGRWNIKINSGNLSEEGFLEVPEVTNWGASSNGYERVPVVADFNHDGATDIGFYNPNDGHIYYKVFNGAVFDYADNGQYFLPQTFDILGDRVIVQTGDFDGDTIPDFYLTNPDDNETQIAYALGPQTDLISEVHNGVGGMTQMTYAPVSKAANTEMPFSIQVMKTITVTDSGSGQSYKTTHVYENGVWDIEDREFRGFGSVKSLDVDHHYTQTKYFQDDLLKGRVKSHETYDAQGNLYSRTQYDWDAMEDIYPGINFIFLKRKDHFVYDGDSSGRRTAEEYFYEGNPQYGQLTKTIQWGEVNLDTGADLQGDERTIETEYV